MENEIQNAIESVNGAMGVLKSLISAQNSAMFYGLVIFLIGATISLFVYRKNSDEVLKNLLDVIRYAAAIIIGGYSLIAYSNGGSESFFKVGVCIYIVINVLVVLIHRAIENKEEKKSSEEK